ncbi:MAG: hypothetical protein K0R54_686 [Clostridiaceae bacterium]|nr:hypothetical protein [Clostridiaceae bacterium]
MVYIKSQYNDVICCLTNYALKTNHRNDCMELIAVNGNEQIILGRFGFECNKTENLIKKIAQCIVDANGKDIVFEVPLDKDL